MKLCRPVKCRCGREFSIPVTTGETSYSAICPSCQMPGIMCEPLSVSVDGDRLMYRSKAELEAGDFRLRLFALQLRSKLSLQRRFLNGKVLKTWAELDTFQPMRKKLSGRRSSPEAADSSAERTLSPKRFLEWTSTHTLRKTKLPGK